MKSFSMAKAFGSTIVCHILRAYALKFALTLIGTSGAYGECSSYGSTCRRRCDGRHTYLRIPCVCSRCCRTLVLVAACRWVV